MARQPRRLSPANGCWTYERVSKQNDHWKLCNENGMVSHADGLEWAHDDTPTEHSASQEVDRINDCVARGEHGSGLHRMTSPGQIALGSPPLAVSLFRP